MKLPRLSVEASVDELYRRTDGKLIVGTPIGLGKPNELLNALYDRAASTPELSLTVFTGLSLDPPRGKSFLEERFLRAFRNRFYGEDYPRLRYVEALHADTLPANITVVEFYFQSGSMLGSPTAQRNYVNANYTHVARDMANIGVNAIVQLVAQDETYPDQLSLSCNADVTLDLLEELDRRGCKPVVVGQLHPDLPFLLGDAVVAESRFDWLTERPAQYRLFGVPAHAVSATEHFVGLHASRLIADGGTLQLGIGSLTDAFCHWLVVRHLQNESYRSLLADCEIEARCGEATELGDTGTFAQGLYAASELFMDGLWELLEAGVLKREVLDDLGAQQLLDEGKLPSKNDASTLKALVSAGVLPPSIDLEALEWLYHHRFLRDDPPVRLAEGTMPLESDEDYARAADQLLVRRRPGLVAHAAFCLGRPRLLERLRDDPRAERICMTGVGRVNQLYGGFETLERRQRRLARFVNTCMKMTLVGGAVSDALVDHQVVSGVGGQYNFVAMAHAIEGGRSILMLRATRGGESNIVWDYPHQTIPRHLRDIVVTEYGVADLRGRTDEQCIEAMVAITDARHQHRLVRKAMEQGKLRRAYEIPDRARQNTSKRLASEAARLKDLFPTFPFGSDFDAVELKLAGALRQLAAEQKSLGGKLRLGMRALRGGGPAHNTALERLGLGDPQTRREKFYARLVANALRD